MTSQPRLISPANEHCFFGYYDLPAWDSSGARHLAHRVPFTDRMPEATDRAEIGYLKEGDTRFHKIAETTAWNFQQGAMLQWLPGAPDRCIFNQRAGDHFQAAIFNANGACEQQLPHPIANVDPLGRFALSINFSRMFDFRPGYGYAGPTDPFADQSQPEKDGIFRIDLNGGAVTPVLSLRQLGELCRPWLGDGKLLVNHLNLNPSGTRFVALVRNFPEPGQAHKTIAVTANADGSAPFILWKDGVASHYHWRDNTVLSMVIKDPQGRITVAEFQDQQNGHTLLDPDFFVGDGHQSYSPDRRKMLYDSYPIDGYRHLYLYDLQNKKGEELARLKSQSINDPVTLETRCDLHPRWHPSGKNISLDSIHECFRGIYIL